MTVKRPSPERLMRKLDNIEHAYKQMELDNSHGYGFCPHYECPLLDAQRRGRDVSLYRPLILPFGNWAPKCHEDSVSSKHLGRGRP